jgi:hypothetical protein
MSTTFYSTRKLRRWAVAAVAANLVAAVSLGLALPAQALALLPIFGLMLPLLTTGVLDVFVTREPGSPNHGTNHPAGRPSRPQGRLTPAFSH